MDRLSITANAIGITTFATTSIAQLHELITSLTEVEDVVGDVSSHLEGIQRPLDALQALNITDDATLTAAKEDLRKAGVADSVNDCGKACEEFGKSLKKWTKHSDTAKLSFRDRLSIGVWKKEKIRTLQTRVQSCQAIVHFAVSSAQLMIQLRSEQTSETERESLKSQLQSLETVIQDHLELCKKQQAEARERRRQLGLKDDEESDDEAQRTLAIKEVDERSQLLEADQVACGVVFSQAHSRRSGQEIGKVITPKESRALVGLPESVVGKINQRIGDVTTTDNSRAVVGVWGGDISMKDL